MTSYLVTTYFTPLGALHHFPEGKAPVLRNELITADCDHAMGWVATDLSIPDTIEVTVHRDGELIVLAKPQGEVS